MLLCFRLEFCDDGRQFWARCHTIRRAADGSTRHRIADMAWPLGRRLAEKLCDRYSITDRAGLHVGRAFIVSQQGETSNV